VADQARRRRTSASPAAPLASADTTPLMAAVPLKQEPHWPALLWSK
jgi:hypothetical protein